MPHIVDEFNDAIRDERERCIAVVKLRADIARDSAKTLRQRGSFPSWEFNLWPPRARRVTVVAGKWEQAARNQEAYAHSLDVVCDIIVKGFDPRKPNPKMTFPCKGCPAPMDCGSWNCCERGNGDWPALNSDK